MLAFLGDALNCLHDLYLSNGTDFETDDINSRSQVYWIWQDFALSYGVIEDGLGFWIGLNERVVFLFIESGLKVC